MVGPGRRIGSWPSPSPTSPSYSSSDWALLRLIIVSKSNPKETEDERERERERERKEALMALKIEREECHHCRARVREGGVEGVLKREWFNCCRVLERERDRNY